MRSYIDSHINKNTSMKMIPAFVMAWNMRLAFAAERYGINKIETDKEKVALYAVQGLEYLEKYMREEFSDPNRHKIPCVQKSPTTALRINGAIGLNWTEKGIDVSRQYCLGNSRQLQTALEHGYFLGVPQSTLRKYGHGAFNSWLNKKMRG